MLVPDVDTYVTVTEADSYFDIHYGYEKWADLDEPTKEQLLRSAVVKLDTSCTWYGEKCAPDQPLAFPRNYPDETCTTPQGIKDGQCEIAYLILDTGVSLSGSLENTMKRLKAGGVEMEYFDRVPPADVLLSGIVSSLLGKYGLCGGGGSMTTVIPVLRS